MESRLTEVSVFREQAFCDPPCEGELIAQMGRSVHAFGTAGFHKCKNGHEAILNKTYPRIVYKPKEVTDGTAPSSEGGGGQT